MAEPPRSIRDTRADQMFLALNPEEIDRLRRFGEIRRYAARDAVVRAGEAGHGLDFVLSGGVEVTYRAGNSRIPIVTHQAGDFMGELAQLSGRPSLVDACAVEQTEVLAVPQNRLRAVLAAEAVIGERIMRALILRRVILIEAGAGGPVIVGEMINADVLRLENFLSRNGHPHSRLDPESDDCARTLVERFQVAREELPIVLCPNGQLLRNPTEAALGRCLGLVRAIDPGKAYDVAIIGAGPAGLATAVYAGSEGLSAIVVDCRAFGGQAGASARIENYLGFPTGISGLALMARAYNQAQKFGVEMAIPDEAVRLEPVAEGFRVWLADNESIRARALVLATGARYRRLDVADLDLFEGTSVHYWASSREAQLCERQEVALVGGGNSAGQAAVYLADLAARVTLIARRPLEATMSSYLVERLGGLANVEIVEDAELSGLEGGDGKIETIRWRDRLSGAETRRGACHLFSFIGADPNTGWLRDTGVELDERGFIRTGSSCTNNPLPLETSRPGIFAVGDVRAGSVKRVASAVGDGAQVVATLHAFLRRQRDHARSNVTRVPVTA